VRPDPLRGSPPASARGGAGCESPALHLLQPRCPSPGPRALAQAVASARERRSCRPAFTASANRGSWTNARGRDRARGPGCGSAPTSADPSMATLPKRARSPSRTRVVGAGGPAPGTPASRYGSWRMPTCCRDHGAPAPAGPRPSPCTTVLPLLGVAEVALSAAAAHRVAPQASTRTRLSAVSAGVDTRFVAGLGAIASCQAQPAQLPSAESASRAGASPATAAGAALPLAAGAVLISS
jgi:hypothetical protein